MSLLSAPWRLVTRWYVSTVLLSVVGLAVGYLIFFNVFPGRPQIAIIDVPETVITEGSAFFIGEMLDYAMKTDSIKAVVIKLTTPGGGAADSEWLYHKIRRLREKKPVVISSGWILASGGVLMSMGANEVFASAGSFVGSIGVIFPLSRPRPPNEQLITSGPAKDIGASDRTFTTMIELLKESFIRTVDSERGQRLKLTPAELSQARLYIGAEAARLGLIDAIGSDTDSIERAAELAGISNFELVDVNEKVLRELILQIERIFGLRVESTSDLQASDFAKLRTIASASPGQLGAGSDLPIGLDLPRMYYLHVAPTE